MDVYVIYPVLCVDIYVISLFALMESKKQKNSIFPSLPSATLGKEGFGECHDHGTQQRFFLKKEKISLPSARVWHSAKNFQKKKKNSLPSAAEVALGKEAVRVDVGFFAEC